MWRKKKGRAGEFADTVRPYAERIAKDEKLREHAKEAAAAAGRARTRLASGRTTTGIATRIASDEVLQRKLKDIVDELREASERLRGKRRRRRARKMLVVGSGLAAGAVAFPQTRRWLGEKVRGSD